MLIGKDWQNAPLDENNNITKEYVILRECVCRNYT